MFCKKCGQPLNEGAMFCGSCGTPTGVQGQKPGNAGLATKAAMNVSSNMPLPEGKSGKKKGGKNVLAILLIFLSLLLAAGITGGFILYKMNEDEPDKVADEEDDEWEEEAPEAEEEKATASWSLPWSKSSEDSEAAETPDKEAAAEEEINSEFPEEERDETGIHTYELIVDDVTWTEAYEACMDRGGHLVRINSEEEYLAILQQISKEDKDKIMFWLGGGRGVPNIYEYHWMYEDGTFGKEVLNEEEPYITYWLDGEPSFYDESVAQDEWCMNMFYVSKEGRWVWNDVPDDLISIADFYAGRIGYICEYED